MGSHAEDDATGYREYTLHESDGSMVPQDRKARRRKKRRLRRQREPVVRIAAPLPTHTRERGAPKKHKKEETAPQEKRPRGRPRNPPIVVKITPARRLAVKRYYLKNDYFAYCQYMWDTLSAETPIWNWHIQEMCQEFQTLAEYVFAGKANPYTLIANVPPACSKSSVFSVFSRGWIMANMPTAQIICTSHTGMLAWDLSQKARDVIQSEKYQELFPEIRLRDDRNAVKMWANTQGGWSLSVGTGTNPVGFHGHFIIIDDPVDPNKAGREASEAITVANSFITETLPNRKVNSATAATVMVMQRLSQNDPSAYMAERFGESRIRRLVLPAQLSDDVRPPELASKYINGLLDPVRLSPKVLADKEVVLGPFGYAGQMQQNPIPRSGGSMQVDKMKAQCCAPPKPEEFTKLVRFWDKAISEKKSGCYTVGALVGERVLKTGGNPIVQYWILDIRRGRWGGDERENVIKATAMMDYAKYGTRVRVGLEQEPGSAGVRDAQLTCRMLAGYRVVAERPTGDKLTRAEPLANQVSAGSVWVAQAEWNQEFFTEFEYFPHSKYKDQVDATSSAFGMLVDVRAKVRVLT